MTAKKYDVMQDVQNPVTSYTEPAKKPGKKPGKKPEAVKSKEFRTNILTTRELWDDFRNLAHLRQTTPNALMEALIKKELEANAGLIKKFKALTAEAQKEG